MNKSQIKLANKVLQTEEIEMAMVNGLIKAQKHSFTTYATVTLIKIALSKAGYKIIHK